MHRSMSIPGESLRRSNSIFLNPSKWSIFPWKRTSLSGEVTPEAHIESQKQDEAWEQAWLNALAFLCLFIAGCVVLAVYYVLEPFLQPLLWAMLIGTMLHPFKHRGTSRIKRWLRYLESSNIPLSVGLVLSPAFVYGWLSQMFEYYVRSYWHHLLLSAVGIICLSTAYAVNLPVRLYRGTAWVVGVLQMGSSIVGQTVYLQLISLALGFVVLLVLGRHSHYPLATKVLSTCLWVLAILNVASYVLGATVALPAVAILFAIASGISLWRSLRGKEGGTKSGGQEGREERPLPLERADTKAAARSVSGDFESEEREGKKEEELVVVETVGGSKEATELLETQAGVDEPDRRLRLTPGRESEKKDSDYVFLVLSAAVLMMLLWRYPFFLMLLSPLALWTAVKFVISLTVVRESVVVIQAPGLKSSLERWVGARKSLLFPTPMPTLFSMYIFVDKKVLRVVRGTIDSIMSAFIILGLVVLGLGVTIFLVFEIQVELSHYVTMSVNVWDRMVTSSPQLQEWLGNATFQDTFGAFANQGYEHGRAWLAGQLHSLVSDSSDNTSVVEQRVLDLFDELYRSYVLKNTTTLDLHLLMSSQEGNTTATSGDDDMLWSELKTLVTDNLATILLVLSSLWTIVSENLTVAFSFLYALLELLFSGGTAFLNLLVFVSTLFYLLCYSERDYLPVKWAMGFLPQLAQGEGSGRGDYIEAFSRAIRSVFHASLRRALFYGLYTWLIHTMFGLPVSILPSVLAAVVGAIPVVGPYWITLPAVLELWLVEGKLVVALTFTALAFLPVLFVDSLIYGEIEGGGHPYLTGLAVAGGMYFAGLEGALIGPILLCCLLFVKDFYSDMTTHNPLTP